MPAKKPAKTSFLPAWLKKLVAYLWGPGRTLVIIVLLIAGLAIGTIAVWHYVGPHAISSGQYTITQDRVFITPQPGWIHTDVRGEVFRDASLDGPLSILDEDLPKRISRAFAMHPWVAKVGPVRPSSPARIDVELVYRRPVCMVEVPGEPLPVDGEGVLLPNGDFSPVEKSSYPRLTGIDTGPIAPAGKSWGDGRVVGAAEIADAFGAVWQQLKLDRLAVVPRAPIDAGGEPSYYLYTRGGTRIFWGLAPGSKSPSELPTAEKLARLLQYVTDHGTLEGNGGPQELDIRTLPSAKAK
jgi:hypothetical protein